MNKIIKITESRPTVVTLPDGLYIGTWGGSTILVKYQDKEYNLETAIGVKGIGYKVVVKIENGESTFEELKNGHF
jgi:hypothetical protein